MLVSIATFNAYSGNMAADTDDVSLKTDCLMSAEKLVKDYLRYDPEYQTYTNIPVKSIGKNRVALPARNVTELSALTIGTTAQDTTQFLIRNDEIYYLSDSRTKFPCGEFLVSFKAGWTNEEMPQIIILTILRIATLMLMEAGENIGITAKSMPDNSRTFINYTKYDRYLYPLQNLRREAF